MAMDGGGLTSGLALGGRGVNLCLGPWGRGVTSALALGGRGVYLCLGPWGAGGLTSAWALGGRGLTSAWALGGQGGKRCLGPWGDYVACGSRVLPRPWPVAVLIDNPRPAPVTGSTACDNSAS